VESSKDSEGSGEDALLDDPNNTLRPQENNPSAANEQGQDSGARQPDGLASSSDQPARDTVEEVAPQGAPRLSGRWPGRRLVAPNAPKPSTLTAEQRLLLLDTWQRSGLPAKDFAALVGISKHTLYNWKQRFDRQGPAGLMEQPRGGPKGSRLPELTKRTILML